MSAYIVEDATINKVVSFLSIDRDSSYTVKRLGIDLSSNKAQAKFARELHRMNVSAVNQRYDETNEDATFWYRFELPPSLVQVYKSLTCFMYQCSEGDVPERELFKKMEEVQRDLAHRIVSELPEYDRAAWG